jgi:hypothetical protein
LSVQELFIHSANTEKKIKRLAELKKAKKQLMEAEIAQAA